jgi:arginine N-succinyltransferase
MFVMEDTATGRLAGVCAIKGAVGLTEPFYNYRIGTLVHSSRELACSRAWRRCTCRTT